MKAFLIEGFAYDEWATLHWVETLPRWRDPTAATDVLEHIVASQARWLERCGWPEPHPSGDLTERVRRLSAMWQSYLRDTHPATPVSYHNSEGVPFTRSLGEIARHVVNHGTYHRGQIRGLAETHGLDEWPDTDIIYYYDAVRQRP